MPETNVNSDQFEISIKQLEKIVAELERGELPLENQLKAFEKGVALSRNCMKRLEMIEKRIEKLIQNSEGELTTTPFTSTIPLNGQPKTPRA